MNSGFVHHGRLCRPDGQAAPAGLYELRFALHGETHGKRSCWSETLPNVKVSDGGFFAVILGHEKPIKPSYFDRGPRFLSTRVMVNGDLGEESGQRVPFTGNLMKVDAAQGQQHTRLGKLEESEEERSKHPSPAEFAQSLEALEFRIRRLESERIGVLEKTIQTILTRLDQIDGDGKRMDLVEDRVDDMDGPDGDIVDLIDRMRSVEAVAPQLFDYLAEETPAMELEALEARVLTLERDSLLLPSELADAAQTQ